MTNTTLPEGVHLDPDGTSRIIADGKLIRLRRPNLAEYADLADVAQEIDTEVGSKRPRLVELNRLVISGDAHDVQRAEARNLVRSIRFAHRPLLERIVAGLSVDTDADGFDFDAAPAWLVASAREICAKLLDHWENVPFHGSATSGN